MKVEFKSSFARDLRKVRDDNIRERLQRLIAIAEQVHSPDEMPGVKKLQAPGNYYRIRLGDYRVGVIISDDTITFIRFLHRKDIYRFFP